MIKLYVIIVLCLGLTSYSQSAGVGVADIDGNVYNSIIIDTQEWMKENLNVSHYRNGDIIPQVTDDTKWENLTTGAWCYYANETANGKVYGKLYNWYAVNDPRGLAPLGWHVPSDSEWTTLITYLGVFAGDKMKETGTIHWHDPYKYSNNSSNFTGLPGGWRYADGTFGNIGNYGNWWSSTELTQSYSDKSWSSKGFKSNYAQARTLNYGNGIADSPIVVKVLGYSLRCVKD